MKAKFAGGPYDLWRCEIPGPLPEVRLPLKVTATIRIDNRVWDVSAVYIFRHGNDLERVYYFDRIVL